MTGDCGITEPHNSSIDAGPSRMTRAALNDNVAPMAKEAEQRADELDCDSGRKKEGPVTAEASAQSANVGTTRVIGTGLPCSATYKLEIATGVSAIIDRFHQDAQAELDAAQAKSDAKDRVIAEMQERARKYLQTMENQRVKLQKAEEKTLQDHATLQRLQRINDELLAQLQYTRATAIITKLDLDNSRGEASELGAALQVRHTSGGLEAEKLRNTNLVLANVLSTAEGLQRSFSRPGIGWRSFGLILRRCSRHVILEATASARLRSTRARIMTTTSTSLSKLIKTAKKTFNSPFQTSLSALFRPRTRNRTQPQLDLSNAKEESAVDTDRAEDEDGERVTFPVDENSSDEDQEAAYQAALERDHNLIRELKRMGY